ncbi:MAG: dTMP kinase [Verrucomicrobiota bacterium]
MNPLSGTLIVFEGIDGTGKSTQVHLLADALRKQGHTVVTSFEPTNGPAGQRLRQSMREGRLSPQQELDLFHEDRRHHVETLINPALQRGETVILDRYYFSTLAYQGTRGFNIDELRQLNESFAPQPNLLFILELDIETALSRIGVRDGQGNDFEKHETLSACAKTFSQLQGDFIHRLSADQPPADLHQQVLATILAASQPQP